MAVVRVRCFTRADEVPAHLQETETHQVGPQRHAGVGDPRGDLQVRRGGTLEEIRVVHAQRVREGVMRAVLPDEGRAQRADGRGEERTGQQAEDHQVLGVLGSELAHQHVHADVRARAHAVGGAELGHPHEHVDAQLLRPAHVDADDQVLHRRHASQESVQHGHRDHQRRGAHEESDQALLQSIEPLQGHGDLLQARKRPRRRCRRGQEEDVGKRLTSLGGRNRRPCRRPRRCPCPRGLPSPCGPASAPASTRSLPPGSACRSWSCRWP